MPERPKWRKHVSEITDRQKRRRAHRVFKLGKKCEHCPARTDLMIGHRDGNESNGRRSNLETTCRSCNGKHAHRMKRLGRGVRTRQYNPKGGAKSLGAYVAAAVSHTRGAHDEAGKVLHDTPKSKRKEFAHEIWERRRMHNPELEDEDKPTHASVKYVNPSQVRGESCKLCVHYIPPDDGEHARCEGVRNPIAAHARCDKFQKASSAQNGRRRNPATADELYKQFHGRGPDKSYFVDVPGQDAYSNHPELAQLGFLIRFIVGEEVELGGEYGDEVKDADWVNQIEFVPSIAKWHQWLEDDEPTVAEAKAYLRQQRAPDVASEPNARQLYIVGGNQFLDDKRLIELGADPEKDICDLGNCYLIEYFTQKRFDKFEPTNYWHHFGEKTGVQPRLMYNRIYKGLFLAGGEYVVKPAGIDN